MTKIYIVIGTIEGRLDWFIEAVSSIKPYLNYIDSLIISFNSNINYYKSTLEELNKLEINCKIRFFCTNKFYSASRHSSILIENLNEIIKNDDIIFYLADDDIIPENFNFINYLEKIRDSGGNSVGVGNFSSFSVSKNLSKIEKQHVYPGEIIDNITFLKRNNKFGHAYTNISSMVISYEVFKNCFQFMNKWGSSGRRAEYILSTHKNIKFLYSPPDTSALIRTHSNQEGHTLSLKSYYWDEVVYIFWVWLNMHETRPWSNSPKLNDFSVIRSLILMKYYLKLQLIEKFKRFTN